ncbi:Aldo/keto reductase [Mycena venus]|uniref:Aldo/keto reductase n=1 Tax=Mycena venus TaxID=2733690 RepID=A0A8H6XIP7_9AGAR|nr:Aldo/keto reductase [Mycena venus]
MPFGTLPLNDGKKIPAIAFGTGSIYKHTDVTRYVQQALDAGFYHIDTAQFYETEQYVGNVIHDSGLARSDLYLTTKYGFGDVQETIRSSLSNLGVEYVDLYLIHNPRVIPNVDAVWKELEIIKKDGLAKSIGVSNFNLETLQSLVQNALIWPAVNQIEFHPYNYAQNKALVEWSSKHGILDHQIPRGPVDAPVAAAAARLGISPTQVLLSWVRAKGVVIVTTTSNKDRLEEYLAVGDLPPLSDADIAAIDEAGAKGPPSFLWSSIIHGGNCLTWKARSLLVVAVLLFVLFCQLLLHMVFTVRM